MQKVRKGVYLDLNRHRDLLLDFLGGPARPLSNHLHPGVGNVGICFHRKVLKSDEAGCWGSMEQGAGLSRSLL